MPETGNEHTQAFDPAWSLLVGWAKLDDGFHDHPKLIGLSLEALGLWTKCFTWAHRHHGTSPVLGHIPEGLPEMFAGTRGKKLTAELVQHRLWDVESHLGGHVIHDYVDYLPAAERPQTSREVSEARSKAGKQGAAKRWGKATTSQDDGKLPEPDGKWQIAPTRPDLPSTSNEVDGAPQKQRRTATRLPDGFTVTDPMRAWAAEHAPGVDPDRATEKFVNYWTAKSGKDATKLDWAATWRNWILTEQERTPGTRQQQRPSKDDRARETLRMGAEVQAALDEQRQTAMEPTFTLRALP